MKGLPVEPALLIAVSGLVRQAGPQVSVMPYTWWMSMPIFA